VKVLLGALTFPQIGELVDWKSFGPGGLNKPILIVLISCVLTLGLFVLGGRKRALVPSGVQNMAEMTVEFISDQIVMQTMGEEGMLFVPYLTTVFMFILFCNLFEIIPIFQFPAPARMAIPLFLALFTWILYNFMGFKRQGLKYIANWAPSGVPKAMYPLVFLIEALQYTIIRPFSLAVRLFANELAGHLLLVTFAILTDTLLFHNTITLFKPLFVLPAVMDVLLTGFEVLVALLQAYIFTILTAVFIGGSMHPEH
jgi:F-type H+-transporting ATPase subunit a